MPLTDLEIRNTSPRLKEFWLSDEKGLRLLVKPNGSCYWRMKYRFAGKQKTLAIGVYPEISLKKAREDRDEARFQVKKGIDPAELRKEQKRKSALNDSNIFSALAKQWWNHQKGTWSKEHANRVWVRLKDNAFKLLDVKPYDQIEPQDIIKVTKFIEKRDALDVAGRVLNDIGRVYSYAVRMGKLKYNPASDLSGVVKTRKTTHRASMKNSELGGFLVDLDGYRGRLLTKYALQLLTYTFVRPGELRGAFWEEFEFENALWRIPGERMKMGTEHLVPLSRQVLVILQKIQRITGGYDLVFPSERDRNEPMSDNTMRRAMFRLGFDGETKGKSKATPHGFRANATSILNEQGFNPDAIERQMSHVERNGVRAAYIHHAKFMDERTKLMQWWADYLDEKKSKCN